MFGKSEAYKRMLGCAYIYANSHDNPEDTILLQLTDKEVAALVMGGAFMEVMFENAMTNGFMQEQIGGLQDTLIESIHKVTEKIADCIGAQKLQDYKEE